MEMDTRLVKNAGKALKSNEKLQKNFQPKDKNISKKCLQKFLTSGEEPMGRAS